MTKAKPAPEEAPASQVVLERVDAAIAKQLAISIKNNSLLVAHNSRLQARLSLALKAIANISAAANNGQICNSVPQYDHATTLQDFCEAVRRQDDALRLQEQRSNALGDLAESDAEHL